MPDTVPEANPPRPSASSHSVRSSMFIGVSSRLRRLRHLAMTRERRLTAGGGGRVRAPPRLQQLGHESRPSGLMRRADAAPRVAVEVLVEEDVVAEVRIVLHPRVVA